jgi:hypothetical protein
MSQEGADVVNLFAMIEAIAKMEEEEEEEAKAKKWAEILPLVTSESAARKNDDGNVPLHLALKNKAPLEVLSRLLAVWPDAA